LRRTFSTDVGFSLQFHSISQGLEDNIQKYLFSQNETRQNYNSIEHPSYDYFFHLISVLKRDLTQDIISDTSGDFQKALVILAKVCCT